MPVSPENIRVAISVTNCLCNDQRVLKIAGVINKLGCDIQLLGRKAGDCCKSDSVPFKTKRFRMHFKKGFLFYAFFNLRLFFYLLNHEFDLLVSNDLDTLLPNFLVSKIRRLPLVYDSHEYFTGVPEIQKRPFVKWFWKRIEKSAFPRLKHVMTVSDSIAHQYEKEYGFRPLTVRNCAAVTKNIVPFSRQELGIKSDDLLLILQGTGININRGGDELIDAISITERVSLLIVGSGDMYGKLNEKTEELKLSDRIIFIPKVPCNTLMKYTKSADAGLSLDKNSNLNYLFSLPNKLFDYLCAGIPVISTDLPELAQIIKKYNCGILVSEARPEEISKAIIKLRDNRSLLADLKRNSLIASESVNWETESKKVEEFYRSIIDILSPAL